MMYQRIFLELFRIRVERFCHIYPIKKYLPPEKPGLVPFFLALHESLTLGAEKVSWVVR